MSLKPTGASRSTPSVPRKSRSPSARTCAEVSSTPIAVATALSVTPAQATSASSSMSPEQASRPLPPVAGCSPAVTSARPGLDLAGDARIVDVALGREREHGRSGLVAVLLLERRLQGAQRVGVHAPDLRQAMTSTRGPRSDWLFFSAASTRSSARDRHGDLVERGLARRQALEPEARREHAAHDRGSARNAGREPDDLVGEAGDQRQRDDARDDEPVPAEVTDDLAERPRRRGSR